MDVLRLSENRSDYYQVAAYKLVGRAIVSAEDGKLMFRFNTTEGNIWIDDVKFQERGSLF